MYIPVSHTNGRSIKNTIGVVMHRLVGMGLKVGTERHLTENQHWTFHIQLKLWKKIKKIIRTFHIQLKLKKKIETFQRCSGNSTLPHNIYI